MLMIVCVLSDLTRLHLLDGGRKSLYSVFLCSHIYLSFCVFIVLCFSNTCAYYY